MDYSKYKLNGKEIAVCAWLGLLSGILSGWLLYRSVYGIFLGAVFFLVYRSSMKSARCEKRKEQLLWQFRDAMQSVAAALQAGYAMENAWRESEREMRELYGENAHIVRELYQINLAVETNQPIEKLLYEFAVRSGCADIQNFAEVFLYAKRSGGDFPKIIQTTMNHISDKIEVEKEVQTGIAAKKMEQKIMNVVPVFILVYLNVTSKEFLNPLYGNVTGVCVMTAALFAYLGTVKLAGNVMRIKV